MNKQPLVETPAVRELRRPGLESDRVTNKTREMLVVKPADSVLACLHADGDAVVACTGLALGFAREAKFGLACCQCHLGATYLCHRT